MVNSVESLKILMDTFGDGWKDQLSQYFRGSREFGPEEKRCLINFFDAYREDFIGNRLFNLCVRMWWRAIFIRQRLLILSTVIPVFLEMPADILETG